MAIVSMQPRGLGKGLSALISENTVAPKTGEGIAELNVSQLQPGKYQPRSRFNQESLQELSDSIAKNGIMQPIVVRLGEGGKYEIVAGERRWRAAKLAGLARVPVILRELADKQALELALVENIQRQDLSPLEEASGYQRLIEEFDYTQEQLGQVVGKSRSHVTNLLRLQSLPNDVKTMLDEGKLTMGHARALLTASDPVGLARRIAEDGLSVRQAEAASREEQGIAKQSRPRGTAPSQARHNGKDADILALEETLSQSLGLTVSINDRGQQGEIVIGYDSLSQLDEVLRRLGGSI